MVTVNSISGGRTSGYMAMHYQADVNIFACVCIDYPNAAPKDPSVLNYCLEKLNGDFIASAESEKTLKVLMHLEQKLGKQIIWVRGKSFDEIIDNAGCLPTWARRFCTTDMKIKPIFEYLWPRYGIVTEHIGFRYDEAHRAYKKDNQVSIFELIDLFGNIYEAKSEIKKKKRNIDSFMKDVPISQNVFGSRRNNLQDVLFAQKSYPLIDDRIEKKHIVSYWSQFPEFDFPTQSNCAGCHHKSAVTIHDQFNEEPQIMEWFGLQEQKGKYNTWHDDVVPYFTKRDMRFTELLDLNPSGSCDSGYCLMD